MESSSLLLKSLPLLLKGAITTIEISLVAMFVGCLGGLFVGIMSSQKLRNPYFGSILSSFVWIIRGTPLFIQLLIVYFALPELLGFSLSPFTAGVVALGVNSSAYLRKGP